MADQARETRGAADQAVEVVTIAHRAKCIPPPAPVAAAKLACRSYLEVTSRCTARTVFSPRPVTKTAGKKRGSRAFTGVAPSFYTTEMRV